MYNGSYSHSTFGLEAKKIHKSKGKSCGYYFRIIFFFSSLIQSLIIASLVLFMVYGQPEQSSEEKRVQDLEESFNKLSKDNAMLRQERSNLTNLLNQTLTKMISNEKDLKKLRVLSNFSASTIINLNSKLITCETEKIKSMSSRAPSNPLINPLLISSTPNDKVILQNRITQLELMLRYVQTNFSQTVDRLSQELEKTVRERDDLRLDAIGLRRNVSSLERQLEMFEKKCKEDFVKSLEGIHTVTRAFLTRIDGLFPSVFPFQLTCNKQKELLDQMRSNCSSLSREVESKFQTYLNAVSDQMAQIQGRSSQLHVQNTLLQDSVQQCTQNRTAMAADASRKLWEAQRKHDDTMERLLKEQKKLRDNQDMNRQMLTLKDTQLKALNVSLAQCTSRPAAPKPPNSFPGLTSFMPNTYQRPGSTVLGSSGPTGTGTSFNLPGMHTPEKVGSGTRPNLPGSNQPGGTFPGFPKPGIIGMGSPPNSYSEIQRHLKELQEMANKGSEVSG